MAEEIVLNVNVNGGQSIAEVKSLKQQFTEAEDALFALAGAGREGTAEFKKAQLEAAKLKERVDDINESLDDLKTEAKLGAFTKVAGGVASGFTAAAGASALFGAESEDLQKQLVKVQAAMAFSEGLKGLGDLGDGFKVLKTVILSNPIFLIVAVVTAVGLALWALKDKVAIIGVYFDAMGKVIDVVIDKLKMFIEWTGIYDFKAAEVHERAVKRNEEAIKSTEDRYDKEIRAAKRAHKATEDLEIQKLGMLRALNNQKIALLDKTNEEELEQINELLVANEEFYQQILDIKASKADKEKAIQDEQNKAYNDRIAKEKKDAEDAAKASEEEMDRLVNEQVAEQERVDAIDEKNRLKREAKKEQEAKDAEEANAQNEADFLASVAMEEKLAAEKIAIAEKEAAAKKQAQADAINATQSLADSVFSLRMLKAKKGSAEELKIAKQQFTVNKALQLAQATMQGIQGVQAAFASGAAIPVGGLIAGPAFAAAAAIAAAANIASIASTQFEGGGGAVTAPSVNAVSYTHLTLPTILLV